MTPVMFLIVYVMMILAMLFGSILQARIGNVRSQEGCSLIEGSDEEWTCSECKESFLFNADGPKENHYRYCSFCGRHVDQLLYQGEDDDE